MLTPVDRLSESCPSFIGGDVTIHPTAVIGLGVILQAAAGHHLEIAAGVTLGSGSIVTAYGGDLTIASGSVLGQASLVVGQGSIGVQACIGAGSTLYNPALADRAQVPAHSLLGLPLRETSPAPLPPEATEDDPWAEPPSPEPEPETEEPPTPESVSVQTPEKASPPAIPVPTTNVVGQVYIRQLLVTLFPHRSPPSASP